MAEKKTEQTPVDFVVLKKKHKLTPKQLAFIQEFLLTFNATKAAKAAATYANDKSAARAGYGFLHRTNVAAALTDVLADRNKTWSTDQERVLQTAMAMAYSDLGDFVEWDKNGIPKRYKSTKEIPKHKRTALKSLRHRVYRDGSYSTEVTLKPSGQALELLMKHKGMLEFKEESDATRGQIAGWFADQEKEYERIKEIEQMQKTIDRLEAELTELKGQSDDEVNEDADEAGT